jgi:predicted site-specific integrase-resolvase
MDYARTEPIRAFARRRGLSPQTVYDWAREGLIETFLLGDRRHVVISSYEQLVERLVTEQAGRKLASPNPRAR